MARRWNYWQTQTSPSQTRPNCGTILPPGTTFVTCAATDASGDTATWSFLIQVTEFPVEQTSNGLVLTWDMRNAILEMAPTVAGPWTMVKSAVSPFVIPADDSSRFYRVRYSP